MTIEEIRERRSKITPGPWGVDDLGDAHFLETNHRYGIGCHSGTGRVAKVEGFGEQPRLTADFIANAPADIAHLLSVIDQLAALVEGAFQEGITSDFHWGDCDSKSALERVLGGGVGDTTPGGQP